MLGSWYHGAGLGPVLKNHTAKKSMLVCLLTRMKRGTLKDTKQGGYYTIAAGGGRRGLLPPPQPSLQSTGVPQKCALWWPLAHKHQILF